MRRLRLLFLVLSFAAFCANSARAEATWLTDYKAAEQQAREQKKLMLLDFTGSDWCPPCILLKRNVLSRARFEEYAAAHLILVEVDFPRRKEQSRELALHNEELRMKFGNVEKFPTLIVANGEGKQVADLADEMQEILLGEDGIGALISALEKLRR